MTTDGRNIDRTVALLDGEAAGIASTHPERARSLGRATLAKVEHADVPREEAGTTYHEQPVLKQPVWKAYIPAYFFVGGLAGASAAMGAAAQIAGGPRLAPIVKPARLLALGGSAVSAALLIADLGKPARFIKMLRVFRPTSPMNMGTWILSAFGATTSASVALPLLGLERAGGAAAIAALPFGLAMSAYTSVLVSNTVVPIWVHGRRTLPLVFVAGAAASAAAAFDLVPGLDGARHALRLFGVGGRVAELVSGDIYERSIAARGDVVARALHRGRAGALWKTSKALTAASLGMTLASFFARGRGARRLRVATGIVGLAGALAARFAIMDAGKASARDPRATFEPQRRDREAREATATG